MRSLFLMATLCLFLSPGSVWAVEESGANLDRTGTPASSPLGSAGPDQGPACNSGRFFFGGGIGYSIDTFRGDLDTVSWDSAYNLDLKAGYFFTEWLALEAIADYAGPFRHKYDWGSSYEDMLNVFTLTANLKLLLAVGDRFSIYAVGGGGHAWARIDWDYQNSHSSEDDSWVRGGMGMNFYATENAALELEISYNTGLGELDDLSFVGLLGNAIWIF